MIRIRNLGPMPYTFKHDGDACLYEVGINTHPAICFFFHKRSDGLATCLRLAADAVEKAQAKERLPERNSGSDRCATDDSSSQESES